MKLTVIIVSYNVSHFLEQCIKSVIKASHSLNVDIIVVDNCSEDDSVSMIRNKFPGVKLIVNPDNRGFSKANNQAIRQSDSDYVLLLNPDTVLEESALIRTLGFMESHPEAGGLGIRMIDGQGYFLPESKRGLPTPWASFCKMSHLSQLFPRSAFLNRYHAGHLSENETNKIEVLAGAFMLLRRKVLDEIGLLDEDFFMYGEDIDLSFRITKAGYFNYYFPEASMIHYKGESTRKSSMNWVRLFYGAMLIFARKHFAGKNERLLSLVILPGVYFRASIAMIYNHMNSFTHSSFWSFILATFKKYVPSFLKIKLKGIHSVKQKITLIIANRKEAILIKELVNQTTPVGILIFNTPANNKEMGYDFYPDTIKGTDPFSNMIDKIEQIHPDELIFSADDLTTDQIITLMGTMKKYRIPYRIAHTDIQTIIGANSVRFTHTSKVNV
jgi:GT2 family glycosyltransferase